ncbi:MAG: hypothetical protein JSV19_11640 [Phycisphaerales bacterium]|nr:MAG: hypothetical protein JSV19_11640 [Phycisphaerales bacterium]
MFRKVCAAAFVLALALRYTLPVMADNSPGHRDADVRHFVPADKALPQGWTESLSQRGQTRVYRGKELDTIGMPVGGIAAGQLYLCGDGTLGCWQLFNRDYFSGTGAKNYAFRAPDKPVDQGFAAIAQTDGSRQVKRLNRLEFSEVEFIGEYPIGRVRYHCPDFPLAVEMEAFSPFIPLCAADSALPATVFHITVRNASGQPVRAGVRGWLENAVCFHNATDIRGLRRSRVSSQNNRAIIVHSAEKRPPDSRPDARPPIVVADFEGDSYGDWVATGEAFGEKPAIGTAPHQQPVSGFWGKGLVNSFAGGDSPHGTLTSPLFKVTRKHLNFLIGGGHHPEHVCINLIVDGAVVRTATGRNHERLLWDSWNVEPFAGRDAQIVIVDERSGAWGHINIDHIELSDEPRKGPSEPVDQLEDFGTMALALDGPAARATAARYGSEGQKETESTHSKVGEGIAYPVAERGYGEITTESAALAPGEGRSFTFVVAWHFPNCGDRGRHYTTRFDDAEQVAGYVLDHHDGLTRDTRLWHDTYYDSTLPYWLLDRIGSTVGNLATGTCHWWADGRFWAWEGVGCCAGTCTHVWNYAHAVARLFPSLERSVRERQDLGAAFHDGGLVGFRGQQNRAYAADGQLGTVLKCYREHQMSPDDGFLKKNWARIRSVLEYAIERDGNANGIIEDSQHNTYDINFHGPNTFVGSLYLAALRAGEEMAGEVGDDEFARRARAIFESGRRLAVERLFNGEYFIQDVDLKEHPESQYGRGCLSDQMFGQGWAHQVGLGYLYPADHVRKALESVWRYNWAPDVGPHNAAHPPERCFARPGEAGLFVCTWPKSEHLDKGVRYRDEVWTGIEYQVAGHMIHEGMVTEALAIMRGIHDRYHPLQRNPYNEVECGDHYARALAAWGAFTALSGYEYHGPQRRLGFAPKLTPENFRAAFTAAQGWGAFSQTRENDHQIDRLEVRWGRVDLQTLVLAIPDHLESPTVTATLDGQPVTAGHALRAPGRLVISFTRQITVEPGRVLEVNIS